MPVVSMFSHFFYFFIKLKHTPVKNVCFFLIFFYIGNSSLDVALECASGGAATVVVACRRGSIILPIQTMDGKPVDQKILTRMFQHVQVNFWEQHLNGS